MIERKFEQPTQEELNERKEMYEKAESLGIDLMSFDGEKNQEERQDIRRAVVLLGTKREIPEDLKKRLISRKQTA